MQYIIPIFLGYLIFRLISDRFIQGFSREDIEEGHWKVTFLIHAPIVISYIVVMFSTLLISIYL